MVRYVTVLVVLLLLSMVVVVMLSNRNKSFFKSSDTIDYITISPNSKVISFTIPATYDNTGDTICLHSTQNNSNQFVELGSKLIGGLSMTNDGSVVCYAIKKNNSQISIVIYNCNTKKKQSMAINATGINSLAITSNGRYIIFNSDYMSNITKSYNNTIIYDVTKKQFKCVSIINNRYISSEAPVISPKGNYVVYLADDRRMVLYDNTEGKYQLIDYAEKYDVSDDGLIVYTRDKLVNNSPTSSMFLYNKSIIGLGSFGVKVKAHNIDYKNNAIVQMGNGVYYYDIQKRKMSLIDNNLISNTNPSIIIHNQKDIVAMSNNGKYAIYLKERQLNNDKRFLDIYLFDISNNSSKCITPNELVNSL